MRKLVVLAGLCLAFIAAPASAAVDLGLPINTPVNFDGNGVFAQTTAAFDGSGDPLAASVGTELFGTGTISGVATVADPGVAIFTPPAGLELTFVFWDAVVTSSLRVDLDLVAPAGVDTMILTAAYADGARILIVQDTTPDFTNAAGPAGFDLQDGEFPTAYTLEDAGYNSDGLADAGSPITVADDAGEEVFLDLYLAGNTSRLTWDAIAKSFISGDFKSTKVEILGGTGASQFADFIGFDGQAAGLILTFSPGGGWTFGGDVDITLTTIPEPATLIFLGTGLVSLVGYRIRRKMS